MDRIVHAFEFDVDRTPPSANKLYTTGYRGRRILSKEGELFKAEVMRQVSSICAMLPWKDAIDAVYNRRCTCVLYVKAWGPFLNKSWKPGRVTEKTGINLPYKKEDVSNYLKVTEDAVSAATGIDDAANFDLHLKKVVRTERALWVRFEIVEPE